MYRRVNKTASSLAVTFLVLSGCTGRQDTPDSAVEITRIPPADKGGPDTLDVIEGRVGGARPGQRIVLLCPRRGLVGAAGGPPALHRDRRRRNVEDRRPTSGRSMPPCSSTPDTCPPASTEALPEGSAPAWSRSRWSPATHPVRRSHNLLSVQRLRVARPRRAERSGRPQPLRSRQRLDRRGRRAPPPHRGSRRRIGRARRSASRAASATARIGSSCATSPSSSRRPSSACSRMTAGRRARTIGR